MQKFLTNLNCHSFPKQELGLYLSSCGCFLVTNDEAILSSTPTYIMVKQPKQIVIYMRSGSEIHEQTSRRTYFIPTSTKCLESRLISIVELPFA